eukprot:918113-Amphidinium_carterae.1
MENTEAWKQTETHAETDSNTMHVAMSEAATAQVLGNIIEDDAVANSIGKSADDVEDVPLFGNAADSRGRRRDHP